MDADFRRFKSQLIAWQLFEETEQNETNPHLFTIFLFGSPSLPIDLAAVADLNDEDEEDVVLDVVENPVIADAEDVLASGELDAAGGAGVRGEGIDRCPQPPVEGGIFEGTEELFRPFLDFNRVGHPVPASVSAKGWGCRPPRFPRVRHARLPDPEGLPGVATILPRAASRPLPRFPKPCS